MIELSFSHLSDEVLLRTTPLALEDERTKAVVVVARFAEINARRLYRRAGYPSMHAFCVAEYRLCEQAAFKRIQAARAGRRFPQILQALADGRLHLTAVVLLAPHLNPQNADELIAAATHKTRSAIERMLAERFPRPDAPTVVRVIPSCSQALTANQLSPGIVGSGLETAPGQPGSNSPVFPERVETEARLASERLGLGGQLASGPVEQEHQPAPQRAEAQSDTEMIPPFQPPARVTPLAPERYALQVTISQETHDKLRRAQELLSHSLPSGNVAEVLDRALDALIRDLEKKKYAATQKPQAKARASKDPRHIPAHVKRAVLARDRGRCTFVSDSGVRCSSRRFLEFDHIHEVARGGRATVSGIRLLCRTHNQYAAECTFGAGFMDEKRRAKAEDHGSLKQRQDAGAAGNEAASAARSTVAKAAERAVSSTVGREPPSVVGSAGEPAAFHASPEKASLAEVFERARLEGFLNTPAPKAPTCNGVIRSPVGDAARLPAMPT